MRIVIGFVLAIITVLAFYGFAYLFKVEVSQFGMGWFSGMAYYIGTQMAKEKGL